jgi:hypothetical protein
MTDKNPKNAPEPLKISVAAAADMLGLTRQRLWQMGNESVLPVAVDGEYNVAELVRRYITFLRDDPRRRADAELKAAKQRKVELEIAQKEGKLVDWSDTENVFNDIFATMSNGLDGLPAGVTRDIAQRKVIADYIDALRAKWHLHFNEMSERLRRGEDPYGGPGDDE